jgi:MFS family permease
MRHHVKTSPLGIDSSSAIVLLTFLTISRVAVAFQFQSVSSLIITLSDNLSFSTTDFGVLLGIYVAPGPLMAIASPSLVHKFGANATMICSLLLMAAGQSGLMLAGSQEVAFLSRLVAGTGGCIVYIVAVDLAARFCGADQMPGRMSIIAASWPLGNALSLVALGGLMSASMSDAAAYLPAAFAIAAALPLSWALRPLSSINCNSRKLKATSLPSLSSSFNKWLNAFRVALVPSISFSFYNISFIIFISFTPKLLHSQGYTLLAASNIASLPMWLFVASVPLGGLLAGMCSRNNKWLVGIGCLGSGACIILSSLSNDKIIWYVFAGLLGGLPTGSMLSRGDHHTRNELFYPTLFFIFFVMLLAIPPLVGAAIEATGNLGSSLVICVIMLVAAFLLFYKDLSP